MDTEHTMCPEVTPADTVVDQSAESLLTDSISAEEMTALKAYFERFAQEVLSSSRCKLNPGDDLPHYLFRKLEKSKPYKKISKVAQMIPDTLVLGVPKAMLTIALIPPILKYVFHLEKGKKKGAAPQAAQSQNLDVNNNAVKNNPAFSMIKGGVK